MQTEFVFGEIQEILKFNAISNESSASYQSFFSSVSFKYLLNNIFVIVRLAVKKINSN